MSRAAVSSAARRSSSAPRRGATTGRASPPRASRTPRCSRCRRRETGPGASRRGCAWESARRSRTSIAPRSGGTPRMSGPSRARARVWSSSTGPPQRTASCSVPRSRSHGCRAPRRRAAARPAPVIRRCERRDDAALEAEHEVLPDRLDRLEPPAVERSGDAPPARAGAASSTSSARRRAAAAARRRGGGCRPRARHPAR